MSGSGQVLVDVIRCSDGTEGDSGDAHSAVSVRERVLQWVYSGLAATETFEARTTPWRQTGDPPRVLVEAVAA
jgi:hypothetical protein